MALDPEAKAFLDQMEALGGPPLDTLPPAEARAAVAMMVALRGEVEDVASVENRRVPGPAGEIPVRIYRPKSEKPLPVLVYFHGGGWVICDLETHDGVCRTLANQVPALVISVDYRLAPEHKFPAAAEDCFAATKWAHANAATIGGDAARLAVGGDSAGGNLAAVVSLMARDRSGPPIRFQLLVYPVTDASREWPSYEENGEGYFLTRSMMRWFWAHYLRGPDDKTNPQASPLRAPSHAGLPPAWILTANYDPLRDEGDAYAAKLREAGVAVELRKYGGMIHGFFTLGAAFPQAVRALREGATALRQAVGG